MKRDSILISLADPVGFVRKQFREYALAALNQYCGQGALPFKTVEYDAVDFFAALVDELSNADESATSLGSAPHSTNLLLRQGLDMKTATWLAFEAYKGVTDAISVYVPEATFGPQGEYIYSFVDEQDLLITRPAQGVQVPYGLRMGGPTILEEIAHTKGLTIDDVRVVTGEVVHFDVSDRIVSPGFPSYRPHLPVYDPSLPSMTSRDIDNLPGGLPPEAREER